MVHGTGGRADRWARNLDALAAAGYHAYAFDLPGHGFAGKGPGFDYSVPGYKAFLGALFDVLNIDQAAVIGTSLGGHVVASFAVETPARVRALVLSGSMGLVPLGVDARGRVQRGANNQTFDGVKDKLHRVIFDPTLITDDFINEEYRINNSPGAKESFAQLGSYIGERLDDDLVGERLAALTSKLPMLLIWGAEDKTVPLAVGDAAWKMLHGSRLAVLARAAHSPYYERPADFNRLVCNFLGGSFGNREAEGVEYR
jgi:pimeloyl-ACP methyl ester carboxylesterase